MEQSGDLIAGVAEVASESEFREIVGENFGEVVAKVRRVFRSLSVIVSGFRVPDHNPAEALKLPFNFPGAEGYSGAE